MFPCQSFSLAFARIVRRGVPGAPRFELGTPSSPEFLFATSRLGKPEALLLAQKWLKPSVNAATSCQQPPLARFPDVSQTSSPLTVPLLRAQADVFRVRIPKTGEGRPFR